MESTKSNDTFLFSSESVGEGHPGKYFELLQYAQLYYSCIILTRGDFYLSRFRCCAVFIVDVYAFYVVSCLLSFTLASLSLCN